ncbi:type II and III secretion system protein family protein [Paraburkholderia sp. MMS20-SJTR3]|uniref:Type II and III secretion system protein family protein n=1 Tax=Paraburkholderia sejongensis TaxID=2886946 RepID=A0ABS8JMR2_9BURK|nr:type II and III secretion system protein family protein [Paraburkholderia sp. MMS20-SJTR3]MCC8391169.1 type II and III secretion system protein family protein [Paraburkholderia sp. MMS20-SJTR3]
MTKRIFALRKAAWLGLALLGVSAITDAASPAQRAAAARASQTHQPASENAPADFNAASQNVELTVGAQRQIGVGHALQRVAIGDPNVADVLIVKGDKRGGVLLVGKAAGTTSLMVWTRDRELPLNYTVNVTTPAAASLLGADTPSVKVLGSTALVSGSTATMESHQRAVVAAQGALGKDGTVFDTSTVANRAVVQVDVRVVEFSRSVLKEIGFNFMKNNNGFTFGSFAPSSLTSFTGGGTPALDVTSTTPISSAFNLIFNSASRGLFANLSLLEGNNLARVLAEPTLVALSGQSASFLAGGEVPVPVPQALGETSIEYKSYGIGLTVTPTVLSPQRIALKVAPEASQLDFTHAVTISSVSVPAFITRRADTTVELGDGESFVIGGLIDRETASNVSKVPLLGDLPVLGAFFKQLSYQQSERELVIIVTPHLVSPLAKGASLPSTPGEQSEQRNAPVWRSLIGGFAAPRDAVPGFSK